MTSIFDTLKGFITGAEGKQTTGKLSDFLEKNSLLINQVITDILKPYFDVKSGKQRDINNIVSLLDPNVCSQMMIFLSKNLEQQLDTYNVGNLGSDISIFNASTTTGKPKNNTRNNLLSKLKEKTIDAGSGMKVSKQDLCDTIAVHYVKILNLLASILVALDPNSNLCLARINNLYTLIESPTEGQVFQVGICTDKEVIKGRLIEEPGIREFLQLYMYHMVRETETEPDKRAVLSEYQLLAKIFDDLGVIESSGLNNNSGLPSENKELDANTESTNSGMMDFNVDFPSHDESEISQTINNTTQTQNIYTQNIGTQNEAAQPRGNMQTQTTDLSSEIRRLNNKFKELENSQKQAKLNKNSELKAEINGLKHTISELMELVKKGKATPDNIEHKLNGGGNTAAAHEPLQNTAATFNTENTSQLVKQANVNQLSPYYYNQSDGTREYPYTNNNNKHLHGYNNTADISKKRLSDLESKLVKLISKINTANTTKNTGYNTTGDYSYGHFDGYNQPLVANNAGGGNEPQNTLNYGQGNGNGYNYDMPIYNQQNTIEQQGGSAAELPNNTAASASTSNRSKSFNTVNKALKQFREFMEKYTEDKPEVRKQFFALFDAKFRAPRPEKLERICTNAKSVGKPFTISISDASENSDVKQFVDNFKTMRAEYMDNAARLVDILESRLLEQYTNNASGQTQYRVRDISGAGLKEIESLTRGVLAELYGKCHRRYLEGINHLDSYFFNKIKQTNISSI